MAVVVSGWKDSGRARSIHLPYCLLTTDYLDYNNPIEGVSQRRPRPVSTSLSPPGRAKEKKPLFPSGQAPLAGKTGQYRDSEGKFNYYKTQSTPGASTPPRKVGGKEDTVLIAVKLLGVVDFSPVPGVNLKLFQFGT